MVIFKVSSLYTSFASVINMHAFFKMETNGTNKHKPTNTLHVIGLFSGLIAIALRLIFMDDYMQLLLAK